MNQLHQHRCCESFCDLRLGKTINNRFGNCIVHTGKNTYTNHNLNYCFLQGLWTLFQLGFVPWYTYSHCVKKYPCLVGIRLNDYVLPLSKVGWLCKITKIFINTLAVQTVLKAESCTVRNFVLQHWAFTLVQSVCKYYCSYSRIFLFHH